MPATSTTTPILFFYPVLFVGTATSHAVLLTRANLGQSAGSRLFVVPHTMTRAASRLPQALVTKN